MAMNMFSQFMPRPQQQVQNISPNSNSNQHQSAQQEQSIQSPQQQPPQQASFDIGSILGNMGGINVFAPMLDASISDMMAEGG